MKIKENYVFLLNITVPRQILFESLEIASIHDEQGSSKLQLKAVWKKRQWKNGACKEYKIDLHSKWYSR